MFALTKTYKKLYGRQDKEKIEHYGPTVICFDLHPEQVQPSHIVIDSLYFRTDERVFNCIKTGSKNATPEQKQRARDMREWGLPCTVIGDIMGYDRRTIYGFCNEVKDEY